MNTVRRAAAFPMLLLALGWLAACGAGGGASGHGTDHASPSGPAPSSGAGHGGGHGEGHGEGREGQSDPDPTAGGWKAAFVFPDGEANAGDPARLTVTITDQDGLPVNEYDVNHEKLLHLIVVSHDLGEFQHLHPEFEGDGRFSVETTFPAGGEYKAFADFIPTGGSATTLSDWLKVAGEEGNHREIAADARLEREAGGKTVSLKLSSTKPKEEVELTFDIRDTATGEGITDLQPYLGAVGHVVILSADAERYLHVHPLDEKATGPQATFATSFPDVGTYKIWGQFKHRNEVITVPFVVDIQ